MESPAITEVKRLRELGAKIGEGTLVFGKVDASAAHRDLIKIGNKCLIASEAVLLCHGYPHDWLPIEVGDNCYIGYRAMVLPGAIVGNNCVIGAGAVISKKIIIPDWSLVVGNPAKIKIVDRIKHKRFTDHMEQFVSLTAS